jgi:TonB-dependent SusC/RagA subfamily outer membrane receptor
MTKVINTEKFVKGIYTKSEIRYIVAQGWPFAIPSTVPDGCAYKYRGWGNTATVLEVTVTTKRRSTSGGLSIPKREVSVAQQTMDFADVEGLAFTSADEALQGKIAGLDIVAGSGNLGAGTQMRLRGVTSINGDKNPLIVVDEQIFDAPDFDVENATEEDYASLLSVNVDDIASITVLKDAASTAIWGSRGANGVIEIKTKRGARGKTKVGYSYKFSGY